MALVMTPIYTRTITSATSNNIVFYNIPQVYTDLMLLVSVRSTFANNTFDGGGIALFDPNFVSASGRKLEGNGASAYSQAFGTVTVPASNATANTFSSAQFYLPNYRAATFKQTVFEGVAENNGTEAYLNLGAQLNSGTNPITAIQFVVFNGNIAANSTFSLYGIIRQGA